MTSSETRTEASSSDASYEIRPYERDDRPNVLRLDETVWNRRRSEEWFTWKYERSPYLDEIPVTVAERDDKIVGARPLIALRLRVGDSDLLALQPSDTMVHSDHRGRGLFTRMTERAIERHADRPPTLMFNFPNRQALSGYLKLGWQKVSPRTTYYRIQDPGPLLGSYIDARLEAVFGRAATTLASGYNALHDRTTSYRSERSSAEFEVRRVNGVPVALLASLYDRATPGQIHAVRDETFYRWRFASPAWDRETYVAFRDGEPTVAVVARTRTNKNVVTITQLADAVPMVGGSDWLGALASVLDEITAEHRGSDVLTATGSVFPHELLASRGFHRNDRFPLSSLKSHDRTVVVRPLYEVEDRPWRLNGVSPTDASSWRTTFVERDTA